MAPEKKRPEITVIVDWNCVVVRCTQNAPRRQQIYVAAARQHCKCGTASVDIQKRGATKKEEKTTTTNIVQGL